MLKPFADWLDVTYSPLDVPEPDLRTLLMGCGFGLERETGGAVMYASNEPRGTVRVHYASRYARISISGGALATLRTAGHFDEVLSILSSSPHKVTRLDVAMDIKADAALVIERLKARHTSGHVALSRKSMAVTTILKTRPDGVVSGTYYVGHRSAARMTARVYDKSFEAYENRGEVYPDPVTRYEVTARKDSGATLKDAACPDSLFWHIAAPALIPSRPKGVDMWTPHGELVGWEHVPRTYVPAEVLEKRIEFSAELEGLMALADQMGDYGRDTLLYFLERKIKGSTSLDSEAS